MSQTAAIYARISEDPRHTEAGVSRQREDCEALVKARGWTLVDVFTNNDVAVMRAGAHRPRYEAMMAAVERGEVTRVVAYGLSRLWRSRTERAAGIEHLKARRVSVALVKGSDLDLSSAAGRGYAGIVGEFDSMESEIKAERVARAALQRAEDGQASGHVAFGWRRVRDRDPNGEVTGWRDVVDEEQAEIVRGICSALLANKSLRAIARDLTERGVPTPRAALRRANGEGNVPAGTWGTGTVRKIALRRANIGRIERDRKDFGPAQAPAIIETRAFEDVRRLLENPQRAVTRRRSDDLPPGIVRIGSRLHMLTYGIGSCGVCGSVLRVGNKSGHALYLCAERGCVGRRQEWVDDLTNRTVVKRLQREDAHVLFARDDDSEAREARERAESLRRKLNEAAQDYADDVIDREQRNAITNRLRPQLDEAERLAVRPVQGVPADLTSRLLAEAEATWSGLDVAQCRALLTAMDVTVRVLPTRQGPGFKPESVAVEFGDEAQQV